MLLPNTYIVRGGCGGRDGRFDRCPKFRHSRCVSACLLHHPSHSACKCCNHRATPYMHPPIPAAANPAPSYTRTQRQCVGVAVISMKLRVVRGEEGRNPKSHHWEAQDHSPGEPAWIHMATLTGTQQKRTPHKRIGRPCLTVLRIVRLAY